MAEVHQAAELLRGREVLEVHASFVGNLDTGQQIVLIREDFRVIVANGFCSWEKDPCPFWCS